MIALCIVILSFLIGIVFYPDLPDEVPSHWNAAGQVDGYMDKFWGAFLMPIISLGLLALFIIIPVIDPKKTNIEKFRKYYDGLIILILAFLFYIYILTLLWATGAQFGMTQMLMPALGILFYYIGMVMDKLKSNWFIGIRTPWTLSSENVWKKTHEKGSIVFKVAGVLAVVSIFFGEYGLFIFLIPVLLGVAYLFVYSYIEYQKEVKK